MVLDREFSYEGFFDACLEEGERLPMVLQPGQCIVREGVYYKGAVKLNLIGKWGKGFSSPLWLLILLKHKLPYTKGHIQEILQNLLSFLWGNTYNIVQTPV